MTSFLPENYERPAASGGNYAKLEDGSNKFRILSDAKVGYVYWNNEGKPVRLTERPDVLPEDIRYENGKPDKVKHFWAFVVWSYRDSKVQILELTQSTIQQPLEDLVITPEWGDPKEYDITITKKGQKLDTEYTVQPSPHKAIPTDAHKAYREARVNLDALFTGDDPFTTPSGSQGSEITADDTPFGAPII